MTSTWGHSIGARTLRRGAGWARAPRATASTFASLRPRPPRRACSWEGARSPWALPQRLLLRGARSGRGRGRGLRVPHLPRRRRMPGPRGPPMRWAPSFDRPIGPSCATSRATPGATGPGWGSRTACFDRPLSIYELHAYSWRKPGPGAGRVVPLRRARRAAHRARALAGVHARRVPAAGGTSL